MNTLLAAEAALVRRDVPGLEPLLTMDEAGEIIRRSYWTVRKYVTDGKIQGVRVGREVLIEPAELRRFIDKGKEA